MTSASTWRKRPGGGVSATPPAGGQEEIDGLDEALGSSLDKIEFRRSC